MKIERVTERERHTETQTERQTERQKTERHMDRQTGSVGNKLGLERRRCLAIT